MSEYDVSTAIVDVQVLIHSENLKELKLKILVVSVVPNANEVEKRFEEFRSVLNILTVELIFFLELTPQTLNARIKTSNVLKLERRFEELHITVSQLTSGTKDLKRYTYSTEI